ncbi:MAG: hypothetical protein OHK0046_44900 [Anaerolineae bacterium]
MRIRTFVLFLLLACMAGLAQAQGPAFEWIRWDDAITVQQDALEITEIQEFEVTEGTVRFGSRTWTDTVMIESVFIVEGSGQPTPLEPGEGETPGTYTITQEGSETALRYYLPNQAQSGDTFVVQINYTTPIEVDGLIDWNVIPGEHAFPINSSTVTINFSGQEVPDETLVRTSTDASISTSETQVVIQSQGVIPAQQPFLIQVPFGEGIGAASQGEQGDTAGEAAPSGGALEPVGPDDQPEGSGGTILSNPLAIICILGLLLLFGGGGLLRGLLGGLGGGRGIFPPTSGGTGGTTRRINPFGGSSRGSSSGRGFRPSSRQRRNVPTVRGKKDSGGSAGLG